MRSVSTRGVHATRRAAKSRHPTMSAQNAQTVAVSPRKRSCPDYLPLPTPDYSRFSAIKSTRESREMRLLQSCARVVPRDSRRSWATTFWVLWWLLRNTVPQCIAARLRSSPAQRPVHTKGPRACSRRVCWVGQRQPERVHGSEGARGTSWTSRQCAACARAPEGVLVRINARRVGPVSFAGAE
ncbi:hypothetical protein DFH06DRAFT_1487696 [Mycena polygramma]|nr:hypothetical protein DFH06DRAFT_1487696 [Mycena polygramma]